MKWNNMDGQREGEMEGLTNSFVCLCAIMCDHCSAWLRLKLKPKIVYTPTPPQLFEGF